MAPDPSLLARSILDILEKAPGQSILGSHLSVAIKAFAPDFKATDFGARNLREFLRFHLPQVYESSRQGLDFVYTLSPVPPASVVPADAPSLLGASKGLPDNPHDERIATAHGIQPAFWKTYVSPNSPYRLFVNDAASEFRVVGSREEAPSEPWIQVPPCSAARHRTIAEQFVATLDSGEAKSALLVFLSEKNWWTQFFEGARRLGVEKAWLDYRRVGLVDELQRTLAGLHVSQSNLPRFREHGMPDVETPKRPVGAEVRRQSSGGASPTSLRDLALALVRVMPDSELRDLKVRLGDVLDALSRR